MKVFVSMERVTSSSDNCSNIRLSIANKRKRPLRGRFKDCVDRRAARTSIPKSSSLSNVVLRRRSPRVTARRGKNVLWSQPSTVNRKLKKAITSVINQSSPLFNNNMQELYQTPDAGQVCNMLQCTKDSSVDQSSLPSSSRLLSFAEFCDLATELKRCFEKGSAYPSSLSKVSNKDSLDRKKRSLAKVVPKHEVFLGGSCNPTTWRQDIAIPLLNQLGISYYNPQVDQWNPKLLELEFDAKESASILFYVINSETRNVAGIIEAAHLAGARRKLILVIGKYRVGQKLCGETISQQEYEELNASLKVLKYLVERQGIPVFEDVQLAIRCTAKVLREDLNVKKNIKEVTSIRAGGHELMKLKEAYNTLTCGKREQIDLSDVYMACRILLGRKISVPELKKIIVLHSGCFQEVCSGVISFEIFCSIVSDLITTAESNTSSVTVDVPIVSSSVAGSIETTFGVESRKKLVMSSNTSLNVMAAANTYDVYIGGYCIDWAENIVIPILRKNNLSYFSGCSKAGSNYEWLNLSSNVAAINNCYTMLFFIPSSVRGITAMTMAAHYIGLGCNVVLCIQNLPESLNINGSTYDQLDEQSINDYNRGRMYLTDLAIRDNIPVLDNLKDAVECIVDKFSPIESPSL